MVKTLWAIPCKLIFGYFSGIFFSLLLAVGWSKLRPAPLPLHVTHFGSIFALTKKSIVIVPHLVNTIFETTNLHYTSDTLHITHFRSLLELTLKNVFHVRPHTSRFRPGFWGPHPYNGNFLTTHLHYTPDMRGFL